MSIIRESMVALISSAIAVILHFFINFLIIFILVNLYSSSDYAFYSLAFTFYWFLLIIATFGMEPVIIRVLSVEENSIERLQKIISIGFRWILLFSLLTAFFIFLSADFFEYLYQMTGLALTLKFLSFFLFFTNIINFFEIVLRGSKKFTLYAISSISLNIIKFCIVLLNYYIILSISTIIGLFALSSLIHCIILSLYIQNKYRALNKLLSREIDLTKNIIKLSFIVFLPLFFSYICQRFNVFILALYVSNSEFSIYNIALLSVDIISIPVIVFNLIILPIVSKYIQIKDPKENKVQQLYNLFLKIGLLYMIPITILFYFISDYYVMILFPPEYIPSSSYLRCYLIYLNIRIIGVVGPNFLYAANQVKTILKLSGITAINILILSLILIPIFNSYGAIISIIIPQSIYLIYTVYIVKKREKIKLDSNLISSILKFIISGVISIFLFNFFTILLNVVLNNFFYLSIFCMLFGISFLGLIFLMKAVDMNTIKNLITEIKISFIEDRT